MKHYHIELVDTLSNAIEEKMRKDLVDYENSHGIDVNYKRFSVVLTDQSRNAFGVLNAFTAFAEFILMIYG